MATTRPLNLLDLSFVLMETRQTPMHVAGLQTFVPPPDAPRDFAKRVYDYLRSFPVTAPPFNYRLRGVGLGHLMPSFEEVAKVDLDYHLRHSALPYPGGERELGVLVSRLHSNPMDMDRPLWEIHLIEGLRGGRIALYGKLHHSLADGVSGVGLLNFSENPKSSRTPPIWAQPRAKKSRATATPGAQGYLPPALASQARALPNLLRGLAGSASAAMGMKSDPDFTSLAESPRTIFNTNITPQRRVATQVTSLARMKAIGDAAGGSVNDVLLAACGAALRRYLAEIGQAAVQVAGGLDTGGAAERRERGGRQRDQLRERASRHRHRGCQGAVRDDSPQQRCWTRLPQADELHGADRLHRADQFAADADAAAGHRLARAADLQRDHLERAGSARQALLPRCARWKRTSRSLHSRTARRSTSP